jgi:hypothetical protein
VNGIIGIHVLTMDSTPMPLRHFATLTAFRISVLQKTPLFLTLEYLHFYLLSVCSSFKHECENHSEWLPIIVQLLFCLLPTTLSAWTPFVVHPRLAVHKWYHQWSTKSNGILKRQFIDDPTHHDSDCAT